MSQKFLTIYRAPSRLLPHAFYVGVIALAAFSTVAPAANLVLNGNFTTVSESGVLTADYTSFKVDDPSGDTIADWTASPNANGNNILTCLVYNGAESVMCGADPVGGIGDDLSLYTYPTGGTSGESPAGGNYILADADSTYSMALSTTLTAGLVTGDKYTLSFYQASAQENGHASGASQDDTWQITIGGQILDGTTLDNPNAGSTPWTLDTINFTYSGTNAATILTFLATSTASGDPPFLLLDNVALTSAVPEPSTLSYLALAVLSICFMRRFWKRA